MLAVTNDDRAYAAGWFDGRGFIRTSLSVGRTPRLTVHIQAGKVHPKFFQDRWGGTTNVNRGKVMTQGGPAYNLHVAQGRTIAGVFNGVRSWSVSGLPALNFLNDIEPYVRVRRRELDLCRHFLRTKHEYLIPKKLLLKTLQSVVEEIRKEAAIKTVWTD